MNSVNIAALVLRLVIGGTMIAHGWNHAFGGGKLPGTARWFESVGIRPGRVHALAATVTELGAGDWSLDHAAGFSVTGWAGAGHRGAGRSRRRRAAAGHLLAPAPPCFRFRQRRDVATVRGILDACFVSRKRPIIPNVRWRLRATPHPLRLVNAGRPCTRAVAELA